MGQTPPFEGQSDWDAPPLPAGGWAAAQDAGSQSHYSGRLAGWWRRLGGALVDGIIVGVPSSVLSLPFHSRFVLLLIIWVVNIAYVSTMLVRRSQTVGMAVFGTTLEVLGAPDTPIPVQTALTRSLAAIAFTLPQFFLPFGSLAALIDVLWPLWDDHNQTLHDKVAVTVVVRA